MKFPRRLFFSLLLLPFVLTSPKSFASGEFYFFTGEVPYFRAHPGCAYLAGEMHGGLTEALATGDAEDDALLAEMVLLRAQAVAAYARARALGPELFASLNLPTPKQLLKIFLDGTSDRIRWASYRAPELESTLKVVRDRLTAYRERLRQAMSVDEISYGELLKLTDYHARISPVPEASEGFGGWPTPLWIQDKEKTEFVLKSLEPSHKIQLYNPFGFYFKEAALVAFFPHVLLLPTSGQLSERRMNAADAIGVVLLPAVSQTDHHGNVTSSTSLAMIQSMGHMIAMQQWRQVGYTSNGTGSEVPRQTSIDLQTEASIPLLQRYRAIKLEGYSALKKMQRTAASFDTKYEVPGMGTHFDFGFGRRHLPHKISRARLAEVMETVWFYFTHYVPEFDAAMLEYAQRQSVLISSEKIEAMVDKVVEMMKNANRIGRRPDEPPTRHELLLAARHVYSDLLPMLKP